MAGVLLQFSVKLSTSNKVGKVNMISIHIDIG